MKFIDFFAGIGGFRSGLEQSGNKCVGWCEWDKHARNCYKAMYNTKGEWTENDIQQAKGTELPEADIWTFGSPCQDISTCNTNGQGLQGSKSSMFFEVIRLLKERIKNKKTLPSYLLMENVKNILFSNEGRDFAEVLIQMESCGYRVEWSVFHSEDFTPQHRERCYIVGHLRQRRAEPVLPNQSICIEINSKKIHIASDKSKLKFKANYVVFDTGLCQTLRATSRPVVITNGKARKITAREAFRLQGFTDAQYDKAKSSGESEQQLYKRAGNAVTVPVVAYIGKKLKTAHDFEERR